MVDNSTPIIPYGEVPWRGKMEETNEWHISIPIYSQKISKTIVGKHDKSIRIEELNSGTHMGMDSHADTTCVNKHAYIESIIEGLTVSAIPLDSSIGKMSNLPIINAIYAYNDPDLIHTILL